MDVYMVLLGAVVVLFVLNTVRRYVDRGHQHEVVELSAGETFLGVLDRGHGDYLFIGDNPRKSYGDVTPEEVEFLKYLMDKEGL